MSHRAGPLVSCIMPTADRRGFVPEAIQGFLGQDYPNRELVILDDGMDAVGDLVPDDPRVRYLRQHERGTLGGKRNECVEASRGDLLMHWDDDDWMAPNRISYQVEALLDAGAEVCGLRRMLFHEPASGKSWLYEYKGGRPWLAGGSLLYTRAFWARSKFPEVRCGEDTRFVWGHRLDRAVVLEDHHFYVAMIHPRNVSPKHPRGAYWSRWQGDLRAVMGEDLDRYHAAAGTAPRRTHPRAAPIRRADPAPAPAGGTHVTAAVPYFGCKEHVARAVESLLRQTHTDLTVVVVNDGDPDPPWDRLAHLDDPRLVRFDLPRNRGRYFSDAVVLAATRSPYFLVQDADDWSEPRRVELLLRKLREEHACGAVSAHRRHGPASPRRPPRVQEFPALSRPLTGRLEHRSNHQGLFVTEALRRIGGFHAGFRIGYDTFLVNALLMVGRISYVGTPLYNSLVRDGSLTSARATGLRSPLRLQVTSQLGGMYQTLFRSYRQYVDGAIDAETLAERIRATVQERSGHEASEVAAEAERLKALLAEPRRKVVAAGRRSFGRRPATAKATPPPDVYRLVGDGRLRWSSWTISKAVAIELAEHLERTRPKRVLELGSGISTLMLAQYAARHGATVVSLEHGRSFHERTARMLSQFGLRDQVDLVLAPLQSTRLEIGTYPWYHARLHGQFDFVFVDGPPLSDGRQAVLPALKGHLRAGWEAWLDDGDRDHERDCLDLWQPHLRFSRSFHEVDNKGQWILRDAAGPSGEPLDTADGLGVSILTGGRPDLLRRTLRTLDQSQPGLLERAYVVVLVHGHDPETLVYLDSLPFVDRRVAVRGRPLGTGPATSRLLKQLAGRPSVKHVLHVEDDWATCTLDGSWLRRARAVLDRDPGIGQVRLRHRSDAVLGYHMVTKAPIVWEQGDGILRSRSAHFTFNPSLLRARDLSQVLLCASELEAQRRFLRTGLAVAQLSPGTFRHIGEGRGVRRQSR
jgi:glycosyltransferase involved in cell wall biosynthesis/predicted O-methyltransferase YrrM